MNQCWCGYGDTVPGRLVTRCPSGRIHQREGAGFPYAEHEIVAPTWLRIRMLLGGSNMNRGPVSGSSSKPRLTPANTSGHVTVDRVRKTECNKTRQKPMLADTGADKSLETLTPHVLNYLSELGCVVATQLPASAYNYPPQVSGEATNQIVTISILPLSEIMSVVTRFFQHCGRFFASLHTFVDSAAVNSLVADTCLLAIHKALIISLTVYMIQQLSSLYPHWHRCDCTGSLL